MTFLTLRGSFRSQEIAAITASVSRGTNDITVDFCSSGNVVSHGRGVDLSLDHHRRAPYENLFTDLDAGAGTPPLWKCGGGANHGKRSGARETFWNIRAAKPIPYPPADIRPQNLYEAQKTARLGK